MKEREANWEKYVIFEKSIPPREADLVDFPEELLEELKAYFRNKDIKQLYSHQAEMFRAAMENKNVVITTSTASGKTISFLLPVIQTILKDPSSRAIFIYPTKALTADQFRAMKPMVDFFGNKRLSIGIYDGDTPPEERTRILSNANIILTNPEMVNTGLMARHADRGKNFIFKHLKYIVIDELHSYRGAFGAHLANIFRRLERICKYYSSSPQFLCSSATIANPVELAENICGKVFCLVSKDGSPSKRKDFTFIQPPISPKTGTRLSPFPFNLALVTNMVQKQSRFIDFCKARKSVEVLLKESRDLLHDKTNYGQDLSKYIEGYCGGYRPSERKEIERKMVEKDIHGLISTNALELGIDIGDIENVIISGYPGKRASFWQQSGRAGRGGKNSKTYMFLDTMPFDQYIALNPQWLFDTKSESAVVDPNNLFIELVHVRAAAAELPLSLDDASIFPDLAEILPILMDANEVEENDGNFIWVGNSFPAGDFNLRSVEKDRYELFSSKEDNLTVEEMQQKHLTVTEMEESRAFRELYKGAIYIHNGETYLVKTLNAKDKFAVCEPFESDYYTVPFEEACITVLGDQQEKTIKRTECHFGDVKCDTATVGFKKIAFHNGENLGFEEIEPKLQQTLETEALWIDMPQEVADYLLSITPNYENYGGMVNYQSSIGYVLKNAALMTTMTDTNDIMNGSINITEKHHKLSVCLYDCFVGGIGYCEKAFELVETIIKNAIYQVENCPCKSGCPACVGDYTINKKVILWALKSMFEKQEPISLSSLEIMPSEPIKINTRYALDDLETIWPEFMQKITENKFEMAEFLTGKIKDAKMIGPVLKLETTSEFYSKWAMKSVNKSKLINLFKSYFKTTEDFDIIVTNSTDTDSDKMIKLRKRYRYLTDK